MKTVHYFGLVRKGFSLKLYHNATQVPGWYNAKQCRTTSKIDNINLILDTVKNKKGNLLISFYFVTKTWLLGSTYIKHLI